MLGVSCASKLFSSAKRTHRNLFPNQPIFRFPNTVNSRKQTLPPTGTGKRSKLDVGVCRQAEGSLNYKPLLHFHYIRVASNTYLAKHHLWRPETVALRQSKIAENFRRTKPSTNVRLCRNSGVTRNCMRENVHCHN